MASRTPELNAADNGASATPVIAQPAPLGMPNLPRTPLPEAHVDAREIAFNRGIGDVRLGMTRAGVGVAYGQPARVENVRGFFPRGTRYFGKVLRRLTYRFNDGTLRVSLVGNRVRAVDTTSRYYRSPGGVGVGSLIPLGPCRKNRFGSCDHRWKGFIYEPVCGKAWLAGTKRVQSIMYARRGRVTAVQIGDPNVILYCF